jgi:chitin synthase
MTDRLPHSFPPADNIGSDPYGDPFSDPAHPSRQTRFALQDNSFQAGNMLRQYDSTTTLPLNSSAHEYDDEEYVEKQPLTDDQNFAGGFYPPA